MAEVGVTLHTGAAGAGAGESAKRSTTSRPAEAKTVVEYIGLTARASKLHKDGEEFMSNLQSEIEKNKIDISVEKIMGDNYEARVITHNGNAVVLIFHETFVRRDMSHIPSVSVTKDIIRKLEIAGGAKVVQVLVIFKDQYEKFENVAVAITNTFLSVDGAFKNVAIQDFNASGELHVSLNLKEVLQFAETTTGSPVSHADTGLLIYAKRRDPNKSGYGTDNDMICEPIGAVVGYTDLKRVAADAFNASFKIDPTFVITGVYSPIRTKEMAMFLISAAADVFIGRSMWLNAFSNFGEGEKNLGNLFINPSTKKPFSCKNIQERTLLIQQHFTSPTPLLAIDLQEGADQFPGLKDLIADPEGIKAAIATFTGGECAKQFDIVQGEAIQYDGLVDTPKGKIDTRAVDFLYLVDPKGANVSHDRAAAFLDYPDPNDPRAIEKKAAQLEEFYNASKIELAYNTHRVFFNPDWVVGLVQDLIASINLQIDSWVNNQVYDVSNFKRFNANLGVGYSAAGGGATWTGWRGFAW